MKKWLIVLIAMLGFATSANAQSFGVRLGIPNLGVEFATLAPGVGTGLKFGVGIDVIGGFAVFGTIDWVIGRIQPFNPAPELSLYYGAGLGVGFAANTLIEAHVVIGLEYMVTPSIAIAIEETPGLGIVFGNVNVFGFKNFIGVLVRFSV
jgi:hypothetical protein